MILNVSPHKQTLTRQYLSHKSRNRFDTQVDDFIRGFQNGNFGNFVSTLSMCYKNNLTTKSLTVKPNNKPWMTPMIKKAIKNIFYTGYINLVVI